MQNIQNTEPGLLVNLWWILSSVWIKEGNTQLFQKWSSEHFFVAEAPLAGSGAPGLLGSRLALQF